MFHKRLEVRVVRIGIIGAGGMGAVHAQAWRAAGADVVGVYSKSLEAAQRLASVVGGTACSSAAELLERVDVVSICTPTPTHLEFTRLAASAGKHVVCEKPIALRVQDAQLMIAACQTAGVRLYIGHVVRFFPQYRLALETVLGGSLGDPGVIRLKRAAFQPRKASDNWFLEESQSGGMIVDLMIHDFDYARAIGGRVERVFARSARAIKPDTPTDYALVTLRFACGAIGLVEGGWAYPQGVFRTGFDIACSDGLIEWSSDASSTALPFLENTVQDVSEVGLPLSILAEDPYVTQIKHVKQALETNTPFAVTPEDALEALRIALAVRQSLETGRVVRLEELPS
jgi:predicted dehydrogenase